MRVLALACLLAVVGCDRAALDPIGTELLIAEPDLGIVQLSPDLTLRLRPPEFSGPLAVTVGTDPVAFDSSAGAFVVAAQLTRGLNRFPLTVTNDAGAVERDTLYAVYLPLQAIAVPSLANAPPRADAAAAELSPGRWLLTGGTGSDGNALASATDLRLSVGQTLASPVSLSTARTGHTATALDGGVLLTGGTASDSPASASDFVPTAEWVGPDNARREVSVTGGIARTRHTARVLTTDGQAFLYLYGGVTPAGNGLARSGTIDVYRIERTPFEITLARLSPPGGSGSFPAVADHLQIPTGVTSAAVQGLAPDGPVAFEFDWSLPGTVTFPFSLRTRPASGARTARTRAAAVDLGGGLFLVSGGRTADGETLGSMEVYSSEAQRSFLVPLSVRLQTPRSDHSATILSAGRIVIGGGRLSGGAPLSAYESFQF